MGAKLDKSRPYGSIHGSGDGAANGRVACYEQDYKEFDAQGDEIVRDPNATAAAPAKPRVTKTIVDGKAQLKVDGQVIDLNTQNLVVLRDLATAMELVLHKQLGKAKTIAAITEAAPLDTGDDQLDQQLAE